MEANKTMICRCIRALFFISLSAAIWTGPAHARENNGKSIAYEVAFQGISDKDLVELLEEISQTVSMKESPPLTEGLLKRRVQNDIPDITAALRSRGYYLPEIRTDINIGVRLARVVFRIDSGPVYRLKTIEIKMAGLTGEKGPDLPDLKQHGLAPGNRALAEPIAKFRPLIERRLKNQGYPLVKADTPEVIVDHQDRTLSVVYPVDTGPLAGFGTLQIEGAETVEHDFIMDQIPWKPGEPFKADLLDEARIDLLETGLFNSVLFGTGDRLDDAGRLPIAVQLTERKHRTLKLGLGYSTDEGAIARVNHERRNVFHRGETVSLLGQVSRIATTAEGSFEKPGFLRSDQSLLFRIRLAEEDTDAYFSRNVTGLVQISRELGKNWEASLGTALIYSDIEELGETRNFQLISFPGALNWDGRDDILDPTRGGNLGLGAAPYYDYTRSETAFVKSSARYSHYLKVISKPRVILAARVMAGFISGAALNDVPADIRFYAGGGGSIRGYAYQSAGQRADSGDPMGGRSLAILSSEIRIRITEKIGLVPFLDGGNVFEDGYPSFDRELLWGAGLGLRYFTPIGPLRLDVAVPLNRRSFDNSFQLYLSLGQAF